MTESAVELRVARHDDAARIAAIYAPNVVASSVSFELEAPDDVEIAARMTRIMPTYPWLVATIDGDVVGYAYASENRTRRAYRWSVEVTIYLDRHVHGRGIGRWLYALLLALLRRQGFVNAYGIITLPNAASVGLHRALGFEPIGVFRHAGFKNGAWLDVSWYQHVLAEPASAPAEPIAFGELGADEIIIILREHSRN